MITSGYWYGQCCGQSYGFCCPTENRTNPIVFADFRRGPKSDNCASAVPHRHIPASRNGKVGSICIAKWAISHVYRFSSHAIH